MINKSAYLIKAGDYLVNLGHVDKVETYPLQKLICFTITEGIVKSAAFYWYESNTVLMTDPLESKLKQ